MSAERTARVRTAVRVFLLALVTHLVALLVVAPIVIRWIAPLGVLLPGRGPRAAAVSFLLDLPILVCAVPAAWLLSRMALGRPRRLALGLVASLYLLDALTALFVTANFDRWMDLWSATARLAGAVLAFLIASRFTRRASAPG